MDSIPSPTHYSLNLNDEIIASELQESLQSRARARAMKQAHALAEESGVASASSNLPSRRGRPPNRVANQGFAFTLHPPDESEENDAQELVRPPISLLSLSSLPLTVVTPVQYKVFSTI